MDDNHSGSSKQLVSPSPVKHMPRYPKSERTASTPGPKPGTPSAPGVTANNGTSYKPETKGRKKVGLLDWSLDDLIAYKHNGTPPARIPDAEILYKLGTIGVTLTQTADLFGISVDKFTSNTDWHDNWKRGRAECGSRIRASIVEDALEKDMLMAKIYLDKTMSGDKEGPTALIQVNVNTELGQVSTDDLLNVVFEEKPNE